MQTSSNQEVWVFPIYMYPLYEHVMHIASQELYIVSMVYHGMLPWFTCFKTPWYPTMENDGIYS